MFGHWCECEKCEPTFRAGILGPRDSMKHHQIFQMIESRRPYAKNDSDERRDLEEKCIVLLNKYGNMPITDSVEAIARIFAKLLIKYDYRF